MDTTQQHKEIKDALEELCKAQKTMVEAFEKHTREDKAFQDRIEPYIQEAAAVKAGANLVKWIVGFFVMIGTAYFMIKGIK